MTSMEAISEDMYEGGGFIDYLEFRVYLEIDSEAATLTPCCDVIMVDC